MTRGRLCGYGKECHLETGSVDIINSYSLPRYCLTVDQFYRMAEVGILAAHDHVELIQGQIIEIPPRSPMHNLAVSNLARLFMMRVSSDELTVRTHGPIRLDDHTEPRPDLAVVRSQWRGHSDSHPASEDVHRSSRLWTLPPLAAAQRRLCMLTSEFASTGLWISRRVRL